jgi:glutamine cyclotransferase
LKTARAIVIVFVGSSLLLLAGCDDDSVVGPTPPPERPRNYTYRIVAQYPHDTNAFTQGLVIDDGALLEGTGRYGESSLREVTMETGEVVRQVDLEASYFGEGITVAADRIVQLTWRNGVAFVYDRATFAVIDTVEYDHQGWGITFDGERLIVSDGSATLRFWDPATYEEVAQVIVLDGDLPVTRLNELEYVAGDLYANIWLTDRIVRIDPTSGEVTGWIDLAGLLAAGGGSGGDVLNGIAACEGAETLIVTGKLWPLLFEIELVPIVEEKRRSASDL